MSAPGEPVQIHLLQLPVPLAEKARQHFEGLMREFALIAAGNEGDHPAHHAPRRLIELVEAGLLTRTKRGTWSYYALVPGALPMLADTLRV